jgi:DNA primase
VILIGEGTNLAKVLHYYGMLEGGSEFKIVCPFHEDVNASMLVNLNEGTWKCFGCEEFGDAFKFVKLMNPKLDDLHVCMEYNKILRSTKTKAVKIQRQAKQKPTDLHALDIASDYYFGLKTIDWEWEDVPEKLYMLKRGFAEQTLNKCKAKLTYNIAYPIVFPMFDNGEFRGWVCRTTNKRVEKVRKYLYNEGFSRRNTLVGNYKNTEVVVLVEGYMDKLKMQQNGVRKVAAILGWKVTAEQIKKLKNQGIKYVVSALDNDKCGKQGTEYLKKFFKVIRFQYPDGIKDPGEMDAKTFKLANSKTKKLYRSVKSKWD